MITGTAPRVLRLKHQKNNSLTCCATRRSPPRNRGIRYVFRAKNHDTSGSPTA